MKHLIKLLQNRITEIKPQYTRSMEADNLIDGIIIKRMIRDCEMAIELLREFSENRVKRSYKLSHSDVIIIRKLISRQEESKTIASAFGVTPWAIAEIKRGKIYDFEK